MTAEALELAANNEKREYDSIVHAVKTLRRTIDRTAERVAKANAAWHDDPEAEDHAEFHAPADVQFPRAMRDEAIRSLVAYYLRELKLADDHATARPAP
jgi:hypothetical protein